MCSFCAGKFSSCRKVQDALFQTFQPETSICSERDLCYYYRFLAFQYSGVYFLIFWRIQKIMFTSLSQTKEPMVASRKKLILWTGPKQSGKTTCAAELVKTARKAGFSVAGLLAPSLYRNGKLIGFDALDLHNNTRTSLARLEEGFETKRFTFFEDGLKHGKIALGIMATKTADLIIVDEFGPLEMEGRLWRKNVDTLLARSYRIILLVVRRELKQAVHRLYNDVPCQECVASNPESISKVVNILRYLRYSSRH